MRATLITISVLALLAVGAGPASARPGPSTGAGDAANHAQSMRALGHHYQRLAAAAPAESAPASVVRVTRVADGGFDWADAAIGAGLAAALLLTAGGVSTVRRQHTLAPH
jgi:hypothetical protein